MNPLPSAGRPSGRSAWGGRKEKKEMWTKIKGNLINLDNVTDIYLGNELETYMSIQFIGEDNAYELNFNTKEERDQEFDRLERLLLNERSY